MTKIAVISDLHANLLALNMCLKEIKKINVDITYLFRRYSNLWNQTK